MGTYSKGGGAETVVIKVDGLQAQSMVFFHQTWLLSQTKSRIGGSHVEGMQRSWGIGKMNSNRCILKLEVIVYYDYTLVRC